MEGLQVTGQIVFSSGAGWPANTVTVRDGKRFAGPLA
jgi:hypothetical protein